MSIILLRATDPTTLQGHVRNRKSPLLLSRAKIALEKTDNIRLWDNEIIQRSAGELSQMIQEEDPDYLFLEFKSSDSEFVKRLKDVAEDAVKIGVGQHPSFSYQLMDRLGFDYVIRGEFDQLIPELVEAHRNGEEMPEPVYSCDTGSGGTDIATTSEDSIPLLDFDLVSSPDYQNSYPVPGQARPNWGFLMSTRGCPHQCSFCSYSIRYSFGKGFRMRNIEEVVDEMEGLVEKGVTAIDFIDDDLTVSRDHVIELCEEIERRDIDVPWIAHARIDEVDRDLLEKMRDAGCYMLRFGIESGSEEILETLQKTPYPSKWKEESEKIFDHCKDLGIETLGLLMLGNPGETLEDIQKTKELVERLDPTIIQAHFFTPFPGTKLADDLGTEKSSKYHAEGEQFSDMTHQELQKIRRNLYRGFYIDPGKMLKLVNSFGLGTYPLLKAKVSQTIR